MVHIVVKDTNIMKDLFKHGILTFALISFVFLMASCTEMSHLQKLSYYVSEHNGNVYSYKEVEPSLISLGHSNTFNNVDDITYSSFTAIVIDIDKYYENLTHTFTQSLYDTLLTDNHVIVIFTGNSDYEFVEGTPFDNLITEYTNRSKFILAFTNFSPALTGILTIQSSTTNDDESVYYALSVLSVYARAINDFVTVQ